MTLEEAKKEVTILRPMYHREIYDLLDEVYSSITNRTCDNCSKWGKCNIKLEDGSYAYFDKDFGCNKWENIND